MNRKQLLSRIDERWHALQAACSGISDAAMLQEGVVEGWSVKDLLTHVATWEEEAMKALALLMRENRPPRYASYGGIDAFNAGQHQKHKALTLGEARQQMQETHAGLLAFLETVPESWYARETRFRHRLRLDTWGHYAEHTKAILAWREAQGL